MKKQIAAVVMAALLVLSVCGAVLCMAGHCEHSCIGADCAVCAVLAQCEQRLHTAVTAAAAITLLCVLRRFLASVLSAAVCEAAAATPVELKVRLLN